MWELNYDDLASLYGFASTYDLMSRFETQRRLLDMLNDNTGVPKRNRAESRKYIREICRRNAIRNRIVSLLEGVSMDERRHFTREELIELRRIKHNETGYDYWPISKSVTRRLRGLVKKQNSRRIVISLGEFLTLMPPSHFTLNEAEI